MTDPKVSTPAGAGISRKDFIKTSAAAGIGMAALAATGNYAFAQGSDRLRIGLVGCGGRGTGAATDHLTANQGVELIAMGDLFEDRLKNSYNGLKSTGDQRNWGTKLAVKPDHMFTGFDAINKVLATPIDVVILATPPGFRPLHLDAAVKAGKHIFMEKPVAVDGPGIRSVLESAEIAGQKKLAIVAGTQRRHEAKYIETIKRIHDGAIGDVLTMQVYWNQGGLWNNPRQPGWTDTENQIRNWLYYTWLSGDHIVEQHIHNIDVANWVLRNHPVKAVALGGRQVRTEPIYGHIYDHFAVEFEYPNGVKVLSFCRQQDGTASKVAEFAVGSKGSSNPGGSIRGETRYRYDGPNPNPYEVEHADLVASIRAGKPLNEGRQVAESTLSAIMGRTAAYTGQEIEWDQMLNSKQVWMPQSVREGKFGPLPTPPVAMPGKTQFE